MREERRQLERRVDDKIKEAVMDAIKHLHCLHEADWGALHVSLQTIKDSLAADHDVNIKTLAQTQLTNGRVTANEQRIKDLILIAKVVAIVVGLFLLVFFPDSPVGKLINRFFGG